MMRAIRDNRDAAEAMGKDVTRRHLQVFVLGSAVVGIAGAMLVTLDGQFTPGLLQPAALHLPDLGDGDRRRLRQQLGRGARRLPDLVRLGDGRAGRQLADGGADRRHGPGGFWREHLLAAAPHLRLFLMGLILLLVLRFAPRGLIPERTARR